MIEIEEGAIFIADSHYPHHGDGFLKILQKIDSGYISTPQIFLMGDIFDILFGNNQYVKRASQDAIDILKTISKKIDIYYFEGNHDFFLKDIFPHITIYPREQQPQ
jgi:UDP-2,3-diacylglucosamine hydrolase